MRYYVTDKVKNSKKIKGSRGINYCSKNKSHYRDCKGKRRYNDYNSAYKFGKRVGLRPYYCIYCDGFHLSSRPFRVMDNPT